MAKNYSNYKRFLRQKRLTDAMLKDWLENTNVAEELISEGLITRDKVNKFFYVSPDKHQANIRAGKYSISKIKELSGKGELPKDECKKAIIDIYIKDIEAGKYSINEIKTLPDLDYNDKIRLVADIHKKKIVSGQYSTEEIQDLLEKDELEEHDLREVLSEKDLRKFLPCIIEPEFFKWTDAPSLQLDRTDVFVLGVPGSGKSTFMSGLLHYAKHNGKLNFQIDNHFGAKYLQQLTDAVYDGCLIERTSHDVIQFMTCDFKDENNYRHPLTFVEMSGEIFKEFHDADTVEIPQKMREYIKGENHKIIALVIDYNEENLGFEKTKQRTQLEFSLKVLEKQGIMDKTDAIAIIITKWDLCAGKDEDEAGKFLKDKGYSALKEICEDYAYEYNINFTFDTFSLGKFYGFRNMKYKYDETDSKKFFEWFCESTAYIDEKRQTGTGGKKKKKSFFDRFFN